MFAMPDAVAPELLTLYPALAALPALLLKLTPMRVPTGTRLFRENDPCQGFPLVLSGEVRVSRGAANGRELELYRVTPGEMCLVSSAGLFANQPLAARGVTTCDTTLCLLSPPDFHAALADSGFRGYVLGLFAIRMADLTGLIEAIAFQKLDSRLASALLGHGHTLKTTHQALADELGTVREIVSRLLHRFERDGLVELSRESITILDSAGLRAVAAGG
ncbi:MAG: transcriptional regulator [Comamonadaceae bacterium]|nr:transcriptional regulator [Comamonadaceae bacterium]